MSFEVASRSLAFPRWMADMFEDEHREHVEHLVRSAVPGVPFGRTAVEWIDHGVIVEVRAWGPLL